MLSIKISTLTAFITVIASFCAPRINVYSADPKSMAGVKVNETNFAILKPAVNRTGSTSERIMPPCPHNTYDATTESRIPAIAIIVQSK
jgi:hypothetical protein